MGRIISVIADDLSFFDDLGEMAINGGMMSVAASLRRFIAEQSVEALEAFLPPALMVKTEPLREAARRFLPPEKRGQGALRFYPLHSLPEVWSDGAPRLLYCADAELMAAHRYLRDRYATGPMPILADTHSLSHHSFWSALRPIATAPEVPYDSIICRAPSTEESLRRGFDWLRVSEGLPPGFPCRLESIPYVLDMELFQPTDSAGQADARRILGLPATGQITLFFGRVTAYSKGDLLPLLECFKRASARDDDYLLIVGREFPTGYLDKLREAGEELGLGERLLLVGEVRPKMRPLFFRAADIFVFPGETTVETYGNTVVEAMACGLPVIVSDWDGLRRHVRDGETGFLVPTYWMPGLDRIEAFSPLSTRWSAQLMLGQMVWVDTDVLTGTMQQLLDDAPLRRRMGEAGRAFAEEMYSQARVMGQWQALWAEVEELARHETPEQKRERQAGAARIGLPMPYMHLFDHYATGVLQPSRHAVRLTEQGLAVAAGDTEVEFYDETLPLLREPLMQYLLETLWHNKENYVLMANLVDAAAAQTEADGDAANDDVTRFHIGLLLKRGLLELSEVLTEDAKAVGPEAAVTPVAVISGGEAS